MTRRFLLAAAVSCFLCAPLRAAGTNLVAQGDRLFAGRTVSTGAAEALALYEKASAENPSDAGPRWKAARALLWLGDHAESRARRDYYQRGIALGETATKLSPDSPDARFWLGALYGSYGESRGVLKSLSLLRPIREQMEALERIDEKWGGGAGVRVLGIVDFKVPGFAGGSRKRALERLTKALAIDPANPFNQYYMAEYLVGAGRPDEARTHLENVRKAGPTADVDAPDLGMIQEKARALEKKLG